MAERTISFDQWAEMPVESRETGPQLIRIRKDPTKPSKGGLVAMSGPWTPMEVFDSFSKALVPIRDLEVILFDSKE